MSDHDTPESSATLDAMARAMAQMAADQSELRSENARLADRLARLERPMPRSTGPTAPSTTIAAARRDDTDAGYDEGGASNITRRSAFKALGAAAAVGAGVAIGATALGADPAGAAPAEYVALGEPNSGDATTSITTSSGYGLQGVTSDATAAAIAGQDTSTGGIGVQAQSTSGLGLVAQGGLAPLQLTPAGTSGPPTSGTHSTGEMYVDATGFVYLCTTPGSPGTWQRITPAAPGYNGTAGMAEDRSGSLNLLPIPIRVFDSRTSGAANVASPDRPAGPIEADVGIILTMTGIAVGDVTIPTGAVGVIGNVTAVDPSGGGYLTLFATAEISVPLASNLNFQSGDQARGNFFVTPLNSGELTVYAMNASTDVVFDLMGFIF